MIIRFLIALLSVGLLGCGKQQSSATSSQPERILFNKSAKNLAAVQDMVALLQERWGQIRPQAEMSWLNIQDAIQNSIVPFHESTQKMIKDLFTPNTSTYASVRYALRNLTEEHKKLAVEILTLSSLLDIEQWGRDYFNLFLQNRPALSELKRLKTLLQEFQKVQKEETIVLRDLQPFKSLVLKGITDQWTSEDLIAAKVFSTLPSPEKNCSEFVSLSMTLDCLGLSHFSKATLLKSESRDRLVQWTMEILSEKKSRHFQELAASFWKAPQWNHCGSAEFSIKRSAVRAVLRTPSLPTSEAASRRELEDLKDLLRDCEARPL